MRWPAYPLRTAAAAAAGVSASLAAYFVQLLTYSSIATIFAQFNATQQRRGGATFLSYFTDTVPLLIGKLQGQYSSFQNMVLLWALLSALVTITLHRWQRHDHNGHNGKARIRLGLAQLFLALIAGAVFASFLLTNYFLEAYFGSLLPLMTFFHVSASAVVAFDLFVIASAILKLTGPVRIAVAVVIGGLVAAPMAHRSSLWLARYPGLSGGYVEVLKKHYMGKPIVVLGHFNQLPTAITWGPTLKMGAEELDVVTANLSRVDRFRNEKKQLVFLCLNLEWVGCDSLVTRMLQKGDELLFRGADFAFIGMNPP